MRRQDGEIVYQYCDTEPQPRDGARRWGCRLDRGGQADGPNGGMSCRLPPGRYRYGLALPTGLAATCHSGIPIIGYASRVA